MHYYTFNIGDYMRDTAHLDEMEDLAYRRMLDLCYLKESPLPISIPEIAKLIRMRSHSESITNVLQEFFVLTESGYQNSKVDTVLTKIYDKSAKAKSSAEKRWNNQKHKNANGMRTHSDGNANGMLPITQLPSDLLPINNIDDSSESPSQQKTDFVLDLFGKFWKHYPTKEGKQKALAKFKALLKGKSEGQSRFWMNLILAYYMDCRERQVIGYEGLHAATYIHNKRWEDNPEFMQNFKAEWLAENGK
jgi:uncharacterized protein YdaU (DUF1376 family)